MNSVATTHYISTIIYLFMQILASQPGMCATTRISQTNLLAVNELTGSSSRQLLSQAIVLAIKYFYNVMICQNTTRKSDLHLDGFSSPDSVAKSSFNH